MANRPALVTEAEVKRTVSGALKAGLQVRRVSVDHRTGNVTVYSEGVEDDQWGPNPDELLK
mgnify:CR=1 FL=1